MYDLSFLLTINAELLAYPSELLTNSFKIHWPPQQQDSKYCSQKGVTITISEACGTTSIPTRPKGHEQIRFFLFLYFMDSQAIMPRTNCFVIVIAISSFMCPVGSKKHACEKNKDYSLILAAPIALT